MHGRAQPVPRLQTNKPTNQTHLPVLDGIRGLAILLVLMSHLSERFTFGGRVLGDVESAASVGWTGVDLFFVLSGFLITGILWGSMQSAPKTMVLPNGRQKPGTLGERCRVSGRSLSCVLAMRNYHISYLLGQG